MVIILYLTQNYTPTINHSKDFGIDAPKPKKHVLNMAHILINEGNHTISSPSLYFDRQLDSKY